MRFIAILAVHPIQVIMSSQYPQLPDLSLLLTLHVFMPDVFPLPLE